MVRMPLFFYSLFHIASIFFDFHNEIVPQLIHKSYN